MPAVKTKDIESIERGRHRGDARSEPVDKDFKSKLGTSPSLFHGGCDLTHIAGDSGDAEQAGFVVEEIVEFFACETVLLREIGEDVGIYGAGASPHHEAFERGEAHSGVYAAAVADSSE